MRCDDAIAELSAWLDGELDGETMRAVAAHLEGCAPCRAERLTLEHTVASLKILEPVRAPEGFATKVLERAFAAELPEGCALLEVGDLSALVDGELDGDRSTLVESHLSGCSTCATERGAAGKTRDLLRALPRASAPPELLERVLERTRPPVATSEGSGSGARVLDVRRARAPEFEAPARAPARADQAPWWASLERLRGVAAAAMLLVAVGVSAGITRPAQDPGERTGLQGDVTGRYSRGISTRYCPNGHAYPAHLGACPRCRSK